MREIGREIDAARKINGEALPHALAEQARDLLAADVLLERRVRARLCDQHAGALGEAVDGGGAPREIRQIALVSRHENGERGERALLRLALIDGAEELAVRDDEIRRGGEGGQRLLKIIARAAGDEALFVEQLAQHLHLRQDETALRGLDVLRHHEQHEVSRLAQVAGDALLLEALRHGAQDRGAQRRHALARLGAHEHGIHAGLLAHAGGQKRGLGNVRLVHHGHHRRAALAEAGEPLELLREAAEREDEQRQVRLFRGLLRFLHAQPAERAHVVETGRVDEHAGPDAVHLHRFEDRVRRCAGDVGDKRRLLARDGVDQRRFSAVPFSENSDVQPVGPRRFCQRHWSYPLSGISLLPRAVRAGSCGRWCARRPSGPLSRRRPKASTAIRACCTLL